MSTKRPRRLSYANVMSTIAFVLALSAGTAYAANEWTGANIVNESLTGADVRGAAGTSSTAAVNGSLTTYDIAGQPANASNGTPFVDGTLSTYDIRDGALSAVDFPPNSIGGGRITDGSVQKVDLGPDSVDSSKVGNNALTGADINESTLGQVPVATLGGLGRSAADESCSPGTAYVRCVQVSLDLQSPARVLLNGRVTAWSQEAGGGTARCRWGGVVESGPVSLEMAGDHDSDLSLVGLTSVIPAGLGWTFAIECQGGDYGYIYYKDAWITAVAISPN